MNTEQKPLSGRVALVTGSGRGLGKAIATRLAELGADIAIHDISMEAPAEFGEAPNLRDSAADLAQFGGRTTAVTGDIANEEAVGQMRSQIERDLGPVEILVNCAGGDIAAEGGKPNPNNALEIKMEDVHALLNRNLIGTMIMCRTFCPPMIEKRTGSVINIASVAAHFGTSPEVVYSTVKAAVVHYTRCLAFEMRPIGVRVNCVSPGPTMTARFLATRKVDDTMATDTVSLNRYGRPEEIADVVGFLAGDEARFVHGQVIRVDGGLTLYSG